MAHHIPQHIKGFTLIEFLVASMLAMIVIVAASSTYMITRKLNHSAQERISVQQDIRNASVQMARDARMAGAFGCFNTGDNKVLDKGAFKLEAKDASAKGLVLIDSSIPDGLGVRRIKAKDLKGLSGLDTASSSDGLLFIYGQSATAAEATLLNLAVYNTDSTAKANITQLTRVNITDESDALKRTLNSKGDVVLSTCSTAVNVADVGAYSASNVSITSTAIRANEKQIGELSLSKLYASLYVLGDLNHSGLKWDDEKALLRYDLGADGKWQNPQLLATGIAGTDGMTLAFGYVDKTNACKELETSPTNSEHFSFVDSPDKSTIGNQLPALVQIRLKYYTNKRMKASDTVLANAQTRDYIINTTVRSGNTCANRLIL